MCYSRQKGYGLSPIPEEKLKEMRKPLEEVRYKWPMDEEKKRIQALRFRFDYDHMPEIGDRCIVCCGKGNPVYFGHRSSQNYYQSGNLTIPVDTKDLLVITLKELSEKDF